MKKLQFRSVLLLVLSALFVTGAFGNTVSLDTTFNGTGYRLQTVGAENSGGTSLAIQADGKIVVAGSTQTVSENNQFALIRLNADGTPDTSFGSNGSAFSPAGVRAASGAQVLIQPDGKILLGATAWMIQQQKYSFIVLRYTSGGVLDTTFNNTGYATANVPNSLWDMCHAMDLGADGKIVLVGQALTTPGQAADWDIAVMRFNADGSLDTGFDGDGIYKSGTTAGDEEAHSVMVQADGKIIVGGRETTDREKFLLMRLNANGSTDTSFAAGGSTIFQIDFTNNNFTSLARQSSGKILAGGGGKITRFTADGIRDMSFGKNGVQSDTGTIERAEIRVIGGDKFLIGTRYGVKRFMPNGAVDTNFSTGFNVSGNSCYMGALGVQSDGRAVIGGYCSTNSGNNSKFAIARFMENRTLRHIDFNGDEATDISIFRPSNGQWWYLDSSTLSNQIAPGQFGTAGDRPVPADYTGDGKADVAVFRPSTAEWFILRSDDGSFYSFPFGLSTDIPVPADYDGDDIADPSVFRPSTGVWYIQKSTGGLFITPFGTSGDKPVPSDYDGDVKPDIAIYRPSTGEWWIQRSSNGSVYAFQFGGASDKPVQGDYTGDRKTDAAFYRPSTGEWFVLRSEDNSFYSIPFGLSDDLPTPGQYTGDGRFDFVVFRPSTNRWHILMNGGFYFYRDFGLAGDQPIPNLFVP